MNKIKMKKFQILYKYLKMFMFKNNPFYVISRIIYNVFIKNLINMLVFIRHY